MIYMRNITITTAKSATYLENVGSYPPDPLIYLQARLYFPPPEMIRSAPLYAIAARMREVAYCLDITDRPLEIEASGLPKLQDCRKGPGA